MRRSRREVLGGGLSAFFLRPGSGQQAAGAPTITGVTLSNNSFVGGSADGTVVGSIGVTMTGGTFSGSLSLTGTDAAKFKVVGTNLELNGTQAAGTYSINIVATQGGAVGSPFSQPETIVGSVAGAQSMTVANLSGSASPAVTPVMFYKTFPRGIVPSGSIASPNGISNWQADNRIYWDDGSLMGATYRLLAGSIAGSGVQQFTFTIAGGSWPNTSSRVVTDITGASDFKVALTNLHTAQILPANGGSRGKQFKIGLTMAAGAITGANVECNHLATGYGIEQIANTSAVQPAGNVLQFSAADFGNMITDVGCMVSDLTNPGAIPGGTTITARSSSLSQITLSNTVTTTTGDSIAVGMPVANGHGTGAFVAIKGGPPLDGAATVAVVAGGSGYVLEGNGNDGVFNGSFNTAVSNNTNVRQYAKGPVCNAWRAIMKLTNSAGTPHPHLFAIFYVERWDNADTSLLAFRAYAQIGDGLADFTDTLYNATYDLDWKNGATVIRGHTNGDTGFTTVPMCQQSGVWTFGGGTTPDVNGRPDWSANSAAFNSIIVQPAIAEADQIKACGIVTPWVSLLPTHSNPSVGRAFTGQYEETTYLNLVQPAATAGIRAPMGTGGSGDNEAVFPLHNALHWLWLKQGNAANSQLWLTACRGVAANYATVPHGAPVLDPTTFTIPNTIPAGVQPFSGMPDLSAKDFTSFKSSGFVDTVAWTGGVPTANPYHSPSYAHYTYLLEGEQWMLDTVAHEAANMLFYFQLVYGRSITLGATTYHGMAYENHDERVSAWCWRTIGYATRLRPTIYADGSTDVERSYLYYCLKQNAASVVATAAYVGNIQWGTAGQLWNKAYDYTGTGIWPIKAMLDKGDEGCYQFMWSYIIAVVAQLSHIWQGDITDWTTFRDFIKLWYAASWAITQSHYLCDDYNIAFLQGPSGQPVTAWDRWANAANPQGGISILGDRGGGLSPSYAGLMFTNGSANIAVGVYNAGSRGAAFIAINPQSGAKTYFPDGSALFLTTTGVGDLDSANFCVIPAPFTTGWYWMKNVGTPGPGSQTIQLYNNPGLTGSPITCTGASTPSAAPVQCWGTPNVTLPADSALNGLGTYSGGNNVTGTGRIPEICRPIFLLKAAGADDTGVNITNAIANIEAIETTMGINYQSYPLNAYDSSYT